MAFLRHHPCEKCGSRNNLAEYANGWYCFGCGFKEGKTDITSLRSRLENSRQEKKIGELLETSSHLPPKALKWLMQYGLTKEEISQFGWNDDRSLLVLYQGNDYWQARNFAENSSIKYMSQGKKPILFYENGFVTETPTSDKVVMVEDIVSAVKVSRVCTSLPLLGSTIALETILRCLERDISKVYIWLDYDKAKESLKAARNASQILGEVRTIVTELDPKELSNEKIKEKIYGYG